MALLELEKSKIRGETMHREYEAKRASPVLALTQLEVQYSTTQQLYTVCVQDGYDLPLFCVFLY